MAYYVVDSKNNPEKVAELREQEGRGPWNFAAVEDAQRFWLDEDENGVVLAYARFEDDDPDGLISFETRYHGCGFGAEIIGELKQERPELYLSGECDSKKAARFWTRMGLEPGYVL